MANKDKDLESINIIRCMISSTSTDRDVIRMIKHSPAGPPIKNPIIKTWSERAGEDEVYMRAREAVKEGRPCKSLPKEDEAHRMGGVGFSIFT